MNTMRSTVMLLVTLLAAIPPAAVFGKTFKWVDARGGVHYTQVPPTEPGSRILEVTGGNDESKQRQPAGRTAAAQPAGEAGAEQIQPAQYHVLEADEKSAAEARKAEALRKQQQEEACNALRNNLKILRQNTRIRIRSGDDKEPRVLTPEEREARIREYSESLDKMCQ